MPAEKDLIRDFNLQCIIIILSLSIVTANSTEQCQLQILDHREQIYESETLTSTTVCRHQLRNPYSNYDVIDLSCAVKTKPIKSNAEFAAYWSYIPSKLHSDFLYIQLYLRTVQDRELCLEFQLVNSSLSHKQQQDHLQSLILHCSFATSERVSPTDIYSVQLRAIVANNRQSQDLKYESKYKAHYINDCIYPILNARYAQIFDHKFGSRAGESGEIQSESSGNSTMGRDYCPNATDLESWDTTIYFHLTDSKLSFGFTESTCEFDRYEIRLIRLVDPDPKTEEDLYCDGHMLQSLVAYPPNFEFSFDGSTPGFYCVRIYPKDPRCRKIGLCPPRSSTVIEYKGVTFFGSAQMGPGLDTVVTVNWDREITVMALFMFCLAMSIVIAMLIFLKNVYKKYKDTLALLPVWSSDSNRLEHSNLNSYEQLRLKDPCPVLLLHAIDRDKNYLSDLDYTVEEVKDVLEACGNCKVFFESDPEQSCEILNFSTAHWVNKHLTNGRCKVVIIASQLASNLEKAWQDSDLKIIDKDSVFLYGVTTLMQDYTLSTNYSRVFIVQLPEVGNNLLPTTIVPNRSYAIPRNMLELIFNLHDQTVPMPYSGNKINQWPFYNTDKFQSLLNRCKSKS